MKNADQPIYPISENEKDRLDKYPDVSFKGLTKREYCAAMAMQGLIISQGEKNVVNDWGVHGQRISKNAAHIADELLKQLSKDTINN